MGSSDYPRGEIELRRVVLSDAVRVLEDADRGRLDPMAAVVQDARSWFRADDWVWAFSFVRIAEVLDIDADAFRRSLGPLLTAPPPLVIGARRHRSSKTRSCRAGDHARRRRHDGEPR